MTETKIEGLKKNKLENIKYVDEQPTYYYTLMNNKHKNYKETTNTKSDLLDLFLKQVKNLDKNKVISASDSDD